MKKDTLYRLKNNERMPWHNLQQETELRELQQAT